MSKKGIVLGLKQRKMIIVTEEGFSFPARCFSSARSGKPSSCRLSISRLAPFPLLIVAAAVLLLFLSFSLVRPFLLPRPLLRFLSICLPAGTQVMSKIDYAAKALQPEGEKLVSQLHLQGESIYTAVGDGIATARGQGRLPTGRKRLSWSGHTLQAKDRRVGTSPAAARDGGRLNATVSKDTCWSEGRKDCRREAERWAFPLAAIF